MALDRGEAAGLCWVALGICISVLANCIIKSLPDVDLFSAITFRYMVQAMTSLAASLGAKQYGYDVQLLGPTGSRHLLVLRAVFFSGALISMWTAMRQIPLGEVTAMVFLNPIICGFLAAAVLGEHLGVRFALQASASFIGVCLVAFPSEGASESDSPVRCPTGVVLSFLAAAAFACSQITVRLLPNTSRFVIQVWQDSVTLAVLCTSQLSQGKEIFPSCSTHDLLWLFFWSAAGLSSSLLLITGFQMAPASLASLLCCIEIPLSFALQIAFFAEEITAFRITGAVLIAGSACIRTCLEINDKPLTKGDEEDSLQMLTHSVPLKDADSAAVP
mmetsp:Transcript_817/g.1558  ORF Transcript_817/g.1558 Transcript_817/m.1558 type:complete len:332 (-) Transcript_817:73-1068(-)